VILLECEGRLEEDGAQAISEVSEDTTPTIVNVSRPGGTVISIRAGRDVREEVGTPSFTRASLFVAFVLPMLPPIAPSLGTPYFGIITMLISI
jgi:hypothetical protein